MGATAMLSEDWVRVDPGDENRCEVKVRNTGTIVDQFNVEVLGDSAPWTRVEPETISLFPGDEGVAQVFFRPPRGATTPAGPVPFGVRVASKEDPAGSAVEEGTVEVGRFIDTFAELVPRTAQGRRAARYELAVDNRGNDRLNARLVGTNVDDLLLFRINPPALVVEPGHAAFANVTVRPAKRFWRGPDRMIPFQVLAEIEAGPPLVADGTMVHEALIPRWLPKALAALAALAILAAIAWFAFLKPKIESTARDAAREEAEEAAASAEQAKREAAAAAPQAAAAGQQAAKEEVAKQLAAAGIPPGAPGGTGGSAAGGRPPGPPIDGRLSIGGQSTFQVPAGKTLQLTDLVLNNPRGNTGTLRIQRDGTQLLVVALDNFRDLDYHFVAPVVFTAGQRLTLIAECTSPDCSPGAYYVGYLLDTP